RTSAASRSRGCARPRAASSRRCCASTGLAEPSALPIIVCGAAGRMGRRLVARAREDARVRVAGAVEAAGHAAIGRDAGEVAGGAALGVRVGDDLVAVCRGEQVVLDFTAPAATLAHARVAAERGAGLVTGTTGLAGGQER